MQYHRYHEIECSHQHYTMQVYSIHPVTKVGDTLIASFRSADCEEFAYRTARMLVAMGVRSIKETEFGNLQGYGAEEELLCFVDFVARCDSCDRRHYVPLKMPRRVDYAINTIIDFRKGLMECES